jgi:hypothetical protein
MDERMAWKDRCGEKGANRAQELLKKTMLILASLVENMKGSPSQNCCLLYLLTRKPGKIL